MGTHTKDPTGKAEVISLRLSPGDLQRLDELRGEGTRTDTIRRLIRGPDKPVPKSAPATVAKGCDEGEHKWRNVPINNRSGTVRKCIACGATP